MKLVSEIPEIDIKLASGMVFGLQLSARIRALVASAQLWPTVHNNAHIQMYVISIGKLYVRYKKHSPRT